MKTVYIGLQPGTWIFGWLVRLVTRSRHGHALIRFGNRCFTAANRGWGWQNASDLKQPTTWYAFDVTEAQYEAMMRWCHLRLGWKYDWISVVKFTLLWRLFFRSREAQRDRRKLFCSEGPYGSALSVGIRLLGEVEPWEVAPGHYRFSSLLRREDPR